MAIVFAVRGDSLNARYSSSGKEPHLFRSSSNSDPGVTANAAAIGGQAIDISGSGYRGLIYPGLNNWSGNAGVSVLCRFIPNFSGDPAGSQAFLQLAPALRAWMGGFTSYIDTTGRVRMSIFNEHGDTVVGDGNFSDLTSVLTTGAAIDFLWTWTGGTGSGVIIGHANNVTGPAQTAANPISKNTSGGAYVRDNKLVTSLVIGGRTEANNNSDWLLDEFVIWDEVIDPNSIGLVNFSTGSTYTGALNGSARVGYVDVSSFDGQDSFPPLIVTGKLNYKLI